ncbi:hypothetical protein [Megasphaera vaginalis (ex Bordigoni et al. 2020)]|uniref:hypothetical protein n=1 Tax=Megasphaera vaginalis (ex Bordigoni et al. 2020) TaxID=2045301 RepID=UPI001356379A|nr:hypothetical protein [Megasphaera vaginalis (ex Bordigoni et al. 2020)]
MRYVNSAVHEEKQSLAKRFLVPQINRYDAVDLFIAANKEFGKIDINTNSI